MSGIYIHIPFCKQACNYCDFHFSTSLKKKDEMVLALAKEIFLRKEEFKNEIVETIYFGGGTPSILALQDITFLIDEVYKYYRVVENPEITIEANPDDLNEERIIELSKSPVNRLSIGIQSFLEKDLQFMNRAHNAIEAKHCLQLATQFFDNISVDLIYGIPDLTNEHWLQNIQTVLDFKIPHISCYALTVETKTVLDQMIKKGKVAPLDDTLAQEQFFLLVETLEKNGYIHYELSNFGKENYFSKNNTSYWLGKKYQGIGPSAHSFDGIKRSWNISNNTSYLKSIKKNVLPFESEILSQADRFNEYIMTGLRTIWGVSIDVVLQEFGEKYIHHLEFEMQKHIENKKLSLSNSILKTTKEGKFFCDGIASDLFYLGV